ncbi:hypothetical protein [Vibrio tapetis]|uniref:Uncharacterized protein n=2 Tax=Vibrio tapetis TaxID=52443 RepID=A0A2N8Z9L9_9VIBR|nr:hypothetical protein [Vibrio tapetis]ACB99598.1 conserved protein [Vibrio tapetis]SON48609.1 conserved protein of unknown function [Vibrio tapetis subsp. tapetis]SON53449.1 conserved protein of unknown function [Vibrio tapetis subsp. tapetis]
MSIPTPEQIKKDARLPENANFHGWLIHNPECDDFLLQYKERAGVISKKWCGLPDAAMRFNRYTRALKVLKNLELDDRAIIVVAFDLGSQIIVIGPDVFQDRMSLPSDNPFRAGHLNR